MSRAVGAVRGEGVVDSPVTLPVIRTTEEDVHVQRLRPRHWHAVLLCCKVTWKFLVSTVLYRTRYGAQWVAVLVVFAAPGNVGHTAHPEMCTYCA